MSRQVDMSDPNAWTDDDIRYLGDRSLLPADMQAEYVPDLPGDLPLEDRAHTGDANTRGATKEQHEAAVAALAEDDYEHLEPPYEQYTNDDLRAELVSRGVEELGGPKHELVARLEENDQENEG